MPEFIYKKQNLEYKSICLDAMKNPSLSLGAKAVYYFISILDSTVKFPMSEIYKFSNESKVRIKAFLDELIEAKYLHKIVIYNETNEKEVKFIITETPTELSEDQITKFFGSYQKKSEKPIVKNKILKITKQIIDYWNTKDLVFHREETKTYYNINSRINKLKKGTFFNNCEGFEDFKGKKFTADEIIAAIDNFTLAATNPDYAPYNDLYKNKMKKLGLFSFFYNAHAQKEKSLFVKYYKDRPEILTVSGQIIEDQYPQITQFLKKIYSDEVTGGTKKSFSTKEENDFRNASKKLFKFFKDNSRKINPMTLNGGTGNPKMEMALLLHECVVANVGGNDITSGWYSSELTFNTRLPSFLYGQGIIKSKG